MKAFFRFFFKLDDVPTGYNKKLSFLESMSRQFSQQNVHWLDISCLFSRMCNYKRHIFLDYICDILLSNEMDGFDSNEKIRFSNVYKYTVWIAEGAVWSFAFVVGGPNFYKITRTILVPLKAKLLHIFILFAEKFLAITVFETWFCRYFLFPGDLIYSMKSVSIPQLQFSFWLHF